MAWSLTVENLLPQIRAPQLLALITEVAQGGTHSFSRPQLATENGVRDGRSNWLVAPPTLMGSTLWAPGAQCKHDSSYFDKSISYVTNYVFQNT